MEAVWVRRAVRVTHYLLLEDAGLGLRTTEPDPFVLHSSTTCGLTFWVVNRVTLQQHKSYIL